MFLIKMEIKILILNYNKIQVIIRFNKNKYIQKIIKTKMK